MTTHVDGNASAGPLSEVFGLDHTAALGRCAGCGQVASLGESPWYASAMGDVLRCADCDNPLLTLVRRSDGLSLSISGLTWIRFRTGR
ncbi:MAG TPA: DUF6510 family protein [Microlunatus sp.]